MDGLDKNNNNNNYRAGDEEEDGYVGVPIHSQVIRVKQEFEKIRHPSLQQLEMTRVVCSINRQRSRSPLGLAERPISVGN
ncbi:hypothetical protein Tsubulata_030819 [Turnera subulata]|uniref:Uncharacterized protein n=1 Tax=Turnera subulata TaxID=218843 RepID=A0A9Q0G9W1_9ROSI|nr:hypothetical protein Tsubulata_030819 [Turnera subulata]